MSKDWLVENPEPHRSDLVAHTRWSAAHRAYLAANNVVYPTPHSAESLTDWRYGDGRGADDFGDNRDDMDSTELLDFYSHYWSAHD